LPDVAWCGEAGPSRGALTPSVPRSLAPLSSLEVSLIVATIILGAAEDDDRNSRTLCYSSRGLRHSICPWVFRAN
jgi:hypothetical protein